MSISKVLLTATCVSFLNPCLNFTAFASQIEQEAEQKPFISNHDLSLHIIDIGHYSKEEDVKCLLEAINATKLTKNLSDIYAQLPKDAEDRRKLLKQIKSLELNSPNIPKNQLSRMFEDIGIAAQDVSSSNLVIHQVDWDSPQYAKEVSAFSIGQATLQLLLGDPEGHTNLVTGYTARKEFDDVKETVNLAETLLAHLQRYYTLTHDFPLGQMPRLTAFLAAKARVENTDMQKDAGEIVSLQLKTWCKEIIKSLANDSMKDKFETLVKHNKTPPSFKIFLEKCNSFNPAYFAYVCESAGTMATNFLGGQFSMNKSKRKYQDEGKPGELYQDYDLAHQIHEVTLPYLDKLFATLTDDEKKNVPSGFSIMKYQHQYTTRALNNPHDRWWCEFPGAPLTGARGK